MIGKNIYLFLFLSLFTSLQLFSQKIEINVKGYTGKLVLLSISGEKATPIDSSLGNGSKYIFNLENIPKGLFKLTFGKGRINFINDKEDIVISTDAKSNQDSINFVKSESNILYNAFLKINSAYKIKEELLNLILARFPKDDQFYVDTKKRINELQTEYLTFVNVKAQKNPKSFAAKYIHSSQLPVLDTELSPDKQLEYLKAHALDYINFTDAALINSDVFTNKTIEYLTYFRNPQLPKELLEKEFMAAVDTLLNKARNNQIVYQHITEYLINGFKSYGFDLVLDYILENYVVKDDLCLDLKTESVIKRRIEQARKFKIGMTVPNIIFNDSNGNEINLQKLNSEKILLVFYSSECPHCKELLPKLNQLTKDNSLKLKTIAISLDTKKENWKNFIESECPNLINTADLNGWDGKTVNDFFIYATPTMFVLDKDKKIISKPLTFSEVKIL